MALAALGAAFVRDGQNVVVVDFDIGLRNPRLDNGRRTTRVVLDLINVINGVAKLPQARLLITRFGRTYFMRGS